MRSIDNDHLLSSGEVVSVGNGLAYALITVVDANSCWVGCTSNVRSVISGMYILCANGTKLVGLACSTLVFVSFDAVLMLPLDDDLDAGG